MTLSLEKVFSHVNNAEPGRLRDVALTLVHFVNS